MVIQSGEPDIVAFIFIIISTVAIFIAFLRYKFDKLKYKKVGSDFIIISTVYVYAIFCLLNRLLNWNIWFLS